MNNIRKRFLLFLLGCILTRSLFAFIAKTNYKLLPYLGALALLPVIGWIYIYFTNSRQTGKEVFGEKIWWNNLRLIHATLYLLFAISALNRKTYSWIFLLLDVILGLSAFLYHHYKVGDFSKL